MNPFQSWNNWNNQKHNINSIVSGFKICNTHSNILTNYQLLYHKGYIYTFKLNKQNPCDDDGNDVDQRRPNIKQIQFLCTLVRMRTYVQPKKENQRKNKLYKPYNPKRVNSHSSLILYWFQAHIIPPPTTFSLANTLKLYSIQKKK